MSYQNMTEEELKEYLQVYFTTMAEKENNLLLFKNDSHEIYILGTIHDGHFEKEGNHIVLDHPAGKNHPAGRTRATSSGYSLANVQSVIETVKPDVLMIEANSEVLEKFNTVDGPIEMIFARCCADELGIPVKGIDWCFPVKNSEARAALYLERDDRMFENILSAVDGYGRGLVLCGAGHRIEMPERFIKNGYSQIEINNIHDYFTRISNPFKYPKRIVEEYNDNINYYKTHYLEEVKRRVSPNDEFYEYYTKGEPEEAKEYRQKLIEIMTENKLHR